MCKRAGLPGQLRGFTLVELLVVIGIIAVLTAILFPVFARVRAKGRQTHCLSNVRQIGVAVLAYAADHEGWAPVAFCGPPPSRYCTPWEPDVKLTWWDIIPPYLGKSESILFCSSVKSYTPTYLLGGAVAEPGYCCLEDVNRPGELIMVVEAEPPSEKMRPEVRYVAPSTSYVPRQHDFPYHHFDRMSACFVDGHVGMLGEQDLDMASPLWNPAK